MYKRQAHDFLVQVVQGVGYLGVAAGEDIGKVLDGLGLHLLLTLLALGAVAVSYTHLALIIKTNYRRGKSGSVWTLRRVAV